MRPRVAICGNCDIARAQGNRLIPAETDQANGLRRDPLKPAQEQGSEQPRDDHSPFSRPNPLRPFPLCQGPISRGTTSSWIDHAGADDRGGSREQQDVPL